MTHIQKSLSLSCVCVCVSICLSVYLSIGLYFCLPVVVSLSACLLTVILLIYLYFFFQILNFGCTISVLKTVFFFDWQSKSWLRFLIGLKYEEKKNDERLWMMDKKKAKDMCYFFQISYCQLLSEIPSSWYTNSFFVYIFADITTGLHQIHINRKFVFKSRREST